MRKAHQQKSKKTLRHSTRKSKNHSRTRKSKQIFGTDLTMYQLKLNDKTAEQNHKYNKNLKDESPPILPPTLSKLSPCLVSKIGRGVRWQFTCNNKMYQLTTQVALKPKQ
jgi:hypothetical protein